jgi:hypothetical protein
VGFTDVHDLAFGNVERHHPSVRPLDRSIYVFLEIAQILQRLNYANDFAVIGVELDMMYHSIGQIVDEQNEEEWS